MAIIGSDIYNPDDDPGAGGSHHESNRQAMPYDPNADPGVGQQTVPRQPPPSLLDTSWRTIVNHPETWLGSPITLPSTSLVGPDLSSGMLHGVREGIIDKPAEWGARLWDLATGDNAADQVRQTNQQAAAAAANAATDPQAYQSGKDFGRFAGQSVVIPPLLRGVGSAVSRLLPSVGGFISGTAGSETPGLPGVVARTTAAGTSGAAAGGLSAALSGEPVLRGVATGGLLGAGAGLGSQLAERGIQTISGTYVPPEVRQPSGQWTAANETVTRAGQARTLMDKYDVPVLTQQINEDPAFFLAGAPWSGRSGDIGNQQQAVRRAALSEVTGDTQSRTDGTGPTVATTKFMDDQGARIGKNFDAITSRNNIDFTNNFAPDLASLTTQISRLDRDSQAQLMPQLARVTQSVSRDPVTGQAIITGDKYRDLTNSKSDLEALASQGGVAGQWAQRIMTSLDNAWAASAQPGDVAALAEARGQYRALKTVDKARQADGTFEPKDLYSATEAQRNRYGGRGPLDELAETSTSVLQPTYDAGGRQAVVLGTGGSVIPGAAGAAGYGLAHAVPGLGSLPWGAAAVPAAAGLGLPLEIQALNRNQAIARAAIEQLLASDRFARYAFTGPAAQLGAVAAQQPW